VANGDIWRRNIHLIDALLWPAWISGIIAEKPEAPSSAPFIWIIGILAASTNVVMLIIELDNQNLLYERGFHGGLAVIGFLVAIRTIIDWRISEP
jgi:hypothetical protein